MKWWLTGLFLLLLHTGRAQVHPAVWHLAELTQQHQIADICQDTNGFILLLTQEGHLIHYDGVHFELDTTNTILAITLHPEGYVVAATAHDLRYRIQPNQWDTTSLTVGEDIKSITYCDTTLWIATFSGGCWQHDGDTTIQVLSGMAVNDVAVTAGRVWVATDRGVYQVDGHTGAIQQHWYTTQGLPDGIVQHLLAHNGGVWAATFQEGLVYISPDSDTINQGLYGEEWSMGPIAAMEYMYDSLLWIAPANGGIIKWRPGEDATSEVQLDIAHPQLQVRQFFTDREGATWAATEEGLLHIRGYLALYEEDNFPPAGDVLAVHAGFHNQLWVSTTRGLYLHTPDDAVKWQYLGLTDTATKELIISIYAATPNSLWLGTFGQGLLHYNVSTGRLTRITEADGLINNNVLSMAGHNDTLWLATLGGVASCVLPRVMHGATSLKFTNYDHQKTLGTNYIYQVLVDSRGRKWFATDGNGITLLEDGQFIHFDASDGLKSEVIYTMAEDPQGNIWFSALHEGVYRYDGTSFRHFGREEGLHGINVVGMACNQYGRLVMMHEEGIDVMDTRNFHLVHLEDDIGLMEVNANLNVIDVSPEGDIWLGLQKGLMYYHADASSQAFTPTISLTGIELYLKDFSLYNDSVLSYQQDHLTFNYAGVWFSNPGQVWYQYKLSGYDLGWITTKDREAIYPNLGPGNYTFRVRASIDGIFDKERVASISFAVRRPFWQSLWFVGLVLLLTSAGVYLYIRGREARLKAMEHMEKERVTFQFQTLRSQVNPHFLFNSFNTLLSIIEQDKAIAATYVEKLSDFFRSILAYCEEEVISLEEELKILEDYYFLQRQRYGDNFQLDIAVPQAEQYFVPPLILQLLVENALKHNIVSRSKPLKVEVKMEGHHLVVRNNRQPKQQKESGTRVGLSNIKQRFALLTQQPVEIEETEQEFTVRLPILTKSS